MALAEDLQVERQDERAAPGRARALEQPLHEGAVAQHVGLEPERRLGVRGDVLDRADAHHAEGERDAELLGRAGREDLSIGMLHARQAGRRDRDRHRGGNADHLRADVAVGHVDGDALAQLDALEVALVGAVGAFRPRAGIGVVVEHARNAPLREHAQVFDVGDDGHGRQRGGGEAILRRVVEERQAVITDRLVRCRRRRRLGLVRCERRDEIGEARERAGANADQAQAPRQVDALQAAAGGAPDRARIERVRGQRQVARRDPEIVEAQLDADRPGGVGLRAPGRRRVARTAR